MKDIPDDTLMEGRVDTAAWREWLALDSILIAYVNALLVQIGFEDSRPDIAVTFR